MVCLCACLTLLSALKTVELTEVTFGTWPWVGPRNHVLGGAQIPPGEGTIFCGGTSLPIIQYRERCAKCMLVATSCLSICICVFMSVCLSQQNLTILSLRENKIRELPSGVGDLTSLLTFDVSHNHLEHLPEGNYVIAAPLTLVIVLTLTVTSNTSQKVNI